MWIRFLRRPRHSERQLYRTEKRTSRCAFAPPAPVVAGCDLSSYNVITVTVKTRIVRIGNSRGIRIPKTLLDEAGLPDDVELHAEAGKLVVSAPSKPRSGWAAAAKRMSAHGDDRMVDEATSTRFDREEWEWR